MQSQPKLKGIELIETPSQSSFLGSDLARKTSWVGKLVFCTTMSRVQFPIKAASQKKNPSLEGASARQFDRATSVLQRMPSTCNQSAEFGE
jgi:hypothetical protein